MCQDLFTNFSQEISYQISGVKIHRQNFDIIFFCEAFQQLLSLKILGLCVLVREQETSLLSENKVIMHTKNIANLFIYFNIFAISGALLTLILVPNY